MNGLGTVYFNNDPLWFDQTQHMERRSDVVLLGRGVAQVSRQTRAQMVAQADARKAMYRMRQNMQAQQMSVSYGSTPIAATSIPVQSQTLKLSAVVATIAGLSLGALFL